MRRARREYAPMGRPRQASRWTRHLQWIGPACVLGVAIFVAAVYVPRGPTPPEPRQPVDVDGGHVCIHDQLPVFDPVRVKQNPAPARAALRSTATPHLMDASEDDGSSGIRITLNVEHLNEDSRACLEHTQGYVEIGTTPFAPNASSICDEPAKKITNCWLLCTDDNRLTAARRQFLEGVLLPTAVNHFKSIIRAYTPVVGNLTLSTSWGGCAVNATKAQTLVPGADFLLMVVARPIFGDTLAFAQSDSTTNRPIAGFINFKPSKLDANLALREWAQGVATHELTHALGYSYGQFVNPSVPTQSRFVNPVTNAPLATTDVVGSYTRMAKDGTTTWSVKMIKTPTVLQVVRDHFDCDTLEGAQLEDGGDGGTADSHWEKRLFQDEYITGTASMYPIYSVLTMAILQDSGWYIVDFNSTEAQLMTFGRHKGCPFARGDCADWEGKEYFCTESTVTGCNFKRTAKGYCTAKVWTTQPDPDMYPGVMDIIPRHRHFLSNSKKGGLSKYSDYCPFISAYSNTQCQDPTADAEGTLLDTSGETYGAGGRCFESTLIKKGSNIASHDLSCHMSGCPTIDLFKFKVGTHLYYDCPRDEPNKEWEIAGYNGKVKCPLDIPCGVGIRVDDEWPLVSSMEPTKGDGHGGTEITVYGSRFTQASSVYVNGVECTDVVIAPDGTNATAVTAKVPNWYTTANAPVTVKDEHGRTGTEWEFELSPSTNDLDLVEALTALLEFLFKWAMPISCTGLAFVCSFSVFREYQFLKAFAEEDDFDDD